MKPVLALDQGTSSSRAILFDAEANPLAIEQAEFPQIYPQPGWVEHDPRALWESQLGVATALLEKAGLRGSDLAAIGITTQRETTLLWDRRTGEPLGNAIVWQDRRTAADCQRLAPHAGEIARRTGLVLDPYFSATKLRWLLDHHPGARARAERGELAFGTVDTWLLWKLTGLHATDPSNASRTMLYNLHERAWDEGLLSLFDIPRALLPEVRPSSGFFAEVNDGPLAGAPVCGIAGDQQAALFGQACFEPGMAKNTYGTGCFLLLQTGEKPVASEHRLLTTAAWETAARRAFALEGSVFIGGAVVQWLRDGLGLIRSAAEVEALAASVSDSAGVYLVPAFAGLGAPHWDAGARGAIFGLTRGTTAAHLARAALEGVAYQCADLLDAMVADTGEPLRELRVDGAMAANALLLQFQADLLQIPVVCPRNLETTALGAALLAGLAAGVWKSEAELSALWQRGQTYTPQRPASEVATLRGEWSRAVERSAGWEQ